MNHDDIDALVAAALEDDAAQGMKPSWGNASKAVRNELGWDLRTSVAITKRSIERLAVFNMHPQAIEVNNRLLAEREL